MKGGTKLHRTLHVVGYFLNPQMHYPLGATSSKKEGGVGLNGARTLFAVDKDKLSNRLSNKII